LSEIYLTPPRETSTFELPGFELSEYLQLASRRWRLIAAVCAVTVSIGLLHYFLTPPQFRATTVVQIEQRSLLPVDTQRNPWLEAWASVKYYPTQYRLLRSRGLAERVVLNLRLMDDPTFNPTRAGAPAGEATASGDEIQIARLARRLVGAMEVDPVESTELVAISYVASDSKLAAKVANGLAEAFIDWGIETRSVAVDKTSRFLEAEIDALKREIQEKEQQSRDLGRDTDIVTLDPETNLTLQRLQKLNSDLATAQKDRVEKEARYNELNFQPKESVAEKESAGLIGEIRRNLRRLESEYESKLRIYTPDWPQMVELKSRIEEDRRNLEQEIDKSFGEARTRLKAEYQSARSREGKLIAEIERVKSEAMDLNQASLEYNNVQMEISAKRGLLDDLLRQQSETGMSARLSGNRESNVRVVDRALVPESPFRPSLRLDLSVGLVGGLLLGIGLVFLFHFLDRTVKTPEEVERIIGLPVLGVIADISTTGRGYRHRAYYGYGRSRNKTPERPSSADGPPEQRQIELLPAREPRLAVSEAYRSLRTALLLSSAERLRVVTITSAESGEGKTATAANLAIVMAQLGRRVLLVDADLRKPRLHRIFEVSNRTGLVNYLTGNTGDENLFLPTEEENLYLCPSGPQPPNPSELLASDRMRDLLESARQHFDFVIVDTPPVLAVTDAALPGSIGDGVVLCFHANKILRADIKSCHDRLRLADVKMLGVVLNRHQAHRRGGYGRRYRYYETYAEEVERQISDSAA
jgi:capsular exopolysaccharide synthesis family protein